MRITGLRVHISVLCVTLVATPSWSGAQDRLQVHPSFMADLAKTRMVDVFNAFPNVGALIYEAGPNDLGIPPGIVAQCSGALIHERVLLLAGHCTAPSAGGLPPFVKAYVSFSPNALDRTTWRVVSDFGFHRSIPPCPPPERYCGFEGLAPRILDLGLVFLAEPVVGITPAKLAAPGTLEAPKAKGSLMIVAGYGFLNSVAGGSHGGTSPPSSEWEGIRRIKASAFRQVVDREWASWSVPGIACYGDSGAPTFYNPSAQGVRAEERLVAVVSDGGWVCFSRDDRARVDTPFAQDWIRSTIAQKLRSPR